MIDQLTFKSRNSFNKAEMVKTVKKGKVRRADMFNYRIVTKMADQFEADARTTSRNQKHD